MPGRVVVRSSEDNHILFSIFKAYYPHDVGKQALKEHRHPEIEISAFTGGSGVYYCNGEDYDFSEGDIFCHSGNSEHCFREIYPGAQPTLVVIRFDPRFVWAPGGVWSGIEFVRLFSSSKQTICRRIPHTEEAAADILSLLNEMFDECHRKDPAYELIVKAKLMSVLAHMVRFFDPELNCRSEDSLPISGRHLALMERSASYILSHLDTQLTLEVLAKEACMSRSYYSTMFKALNGISVWDYITMQRIDLAQYQLENTGATITQICENCGFTSISNFNRAFKKLTGRSPREYRKLSAEKNEKKTMEDVIQK